MQILKKLADYQLEEFKRIKDIRNFRSKKNRQIRQDFLATNTVNIFEFFYWYRIKANYRDLEFLNQEISDEEFSDFYQNYYQLAVSFYKCFRELINELSQKRFGRLLIA